MTADVNNGLRRALRRARDGVALDATEAEILLGARGDALADLCGSAARVRDQGLADAGRPGVVTYSRKVFIPLTRLCRDRCHYCTFATTPNRVPAPFLSPDEVLAIATQGAALGCKEALFTLGDRPEDRWPAAREWLDAHGYDSTLAYVRAMSILVLEKTGLLPHLNPGVMTWAELQRLKPVAPSMGMMLETTSRRLFEDPHGAHFGSPDKDPAVRIRVLEDAGRSNIPFTTGILIGIGETPAERVDSIFEIRRIARAYGGVQEVIVQNFRAKPDTAMARMPDAELGDLAATVAVARLVLGPRVRIQAPPNLIGEEFRLLLEAGIDDWGGVSPLTPDHVNPERPWPQIEELAARSADAGFRLVERLTVYPNYVQAGEPWLDPRVMPHVAALAGPDGLARADAELVGRPWQEPEDGWSDSSGRVDLHTAIDTEGRTTDRRADFDSVYGDWASVAARGAAHRRARPLRPRRRRGAARGRARPGRAVRRRRAGPAARRRAPSSTRSPRWPTRCARTSSAATSPTSSTATSTSPTSATPAAASARSPSAAPTPTRTRCRWTSSARRAEEAWDLGATEVCMQGGIHPDLPGTAYFDIARAVKERVPGMHVHAFSPMEIVNGAARTGLSVREWLQTAKDAGLDSIPGTAAEILDDDVRWLLTKGKLPASEWIDVVTTAHELGIRSSSTMMYGHVDNPSHWLGHFRTLARVQDRTGGFTEFVALPFIHTNAPIYLAGVARPGPTERENRVVHAMARILLHGRIDNIQCSWVKLGVEGCRQVLTGGVNDLGGTLMEETISRMAGSSHGSAKTVEQLHEIVRPLTGRRARQRMTDYGPVPDERLAAAGRFTGTLPSLAG